MNQDILLETIEIISRHLLTNPAFCGGDEGRRLSELLWQLTGTSRFKTVSEPRPQTENTVDRLVTLPAGIDNVLTAASRKTGVPLNVLIQSALEVVIAEGRLG